MSSGTWIISTYWYHRISWYSSTIQKKCAFLNSHQNDKQAFRLCAISCQIFAIMLYFQSAHAVLILRRLALVYGFPLKQFLGRIFDRDEDKPVLKALEALVRRHAANFGPNTATRLGLQTPLSAHKVCLAMDHPEMFGDFPEMVGISAPAGFSPLYTDPGFLTSTLSRVAVLHPGSNL